MFRIFDVKHKILDELYQVQMISSKDTLVSNWLDLDILQKRMKSGEKEFYSSLELLNLENEISVDWNQKLAVVTAIGISSLNSKKYYDIHKKRVRETVIFWLKIIGYSSVFLTIIKSIIEITNSIKRS